MPIPHVEIVLDYVCVHSYLGFTRIRRIAESRGVPLVISPYLLRPDAGEVPEPVFEVHRRERGEEFARAVRADRGIGAADGLDIRLDRARFVGTRRAHRLTAHAAAQGRAVPLAERIFRAYFTDGRDIADADTLDTLAIEAGVDPAGEWPEITAALAANADVRQTPVFRFPDGTVRTGDQSADTLDAALAAALVAD